MTRRKIPEFCKDIRGPGDEYAPWRRNIQRPNERNYATLHFIRRALTKVEDRKHPHKILTSMLAYSWVRGRHTTWDYFPDAFERYNNQLDIEVPGQVDDLDWRACITLLCRLRPVRVRVNFAEYFAKHMVFTGDSKKDREAHIQLLSFCYGYIRSLKFMTLIFEIILVMPHGSFYDPLSQIILNELSDVSRVIEFYSIEDFYRLSDFLRTPLLQKVVLKNNRNTLFNPMQCQRLFKLRANELEVHFTSGSKASSPFAPCFRLSMDAFKFNYYAQRINIVCHQFWNYPSRFNNFDSLLSSLKAGTSGKIKYFLKGEDVIDNEIKAQNALEDLKNIWDILIKNDVQFEFEFMLSTKFKHSIFTKQYLHLQKCWKDTGCIVGTCWKDGYMVLFVRYHDHHNYSISY